MRILFRDIFNENNDGSLTPKKPIRVNGVSMSPGVVFQNGVAFGGIDFHLYKYWDIEAEEKDGFTEITGFYPQ
jgi:hypothetical protein